MKRGLDSGCPLKTELTYISWGQNEYNRMFKSDSLVFSKNTWMGLCYLIWWEDGEHCGNRVGKVVTGSIGGILILVCHEMPSSSLDK